MELCQWVADYYLAGIGDAIAAALPPGAAQRPSAFKTRRVAVATVQGLSALGVADSGLTQKQRAALELVAAASGLDQREMGERGASRDVVARLVALGPGDLAPRPGRARSLSARGRAAGVA